MVYGDKYLDDVSGVVMVDVRPPAFSERTAAALPPKSVLASPKRSSRPDPRKRGRRIQPEPGGYRPTRSAAEAGASKGFGDRPLVVLTAGDRAGLTEGLPALLAKEFDSIWMELQTGLVGLSTKGSQQVVAGATHDMPFEKPDVIVDAIREVLDGSGG